MSDYTEAMISLAEMLPLEAADPRIRAIANEVARLNEAGQKLLQHHINEDARIGAERDEALAEVKRLKAEIEERAETEASLTKMIAEKAGLRVMLATHVWATTSDPWTAVCLKCGIHEGDPDEYRECAAKACICTSYSRHPTCPVHGAGGTNPTETK